MIALPTAKGAFLAGSLGSKAPAPLCSELNHTDTSGSAHCSLQPVWSLVNGSSNVFMLGDPSRVWENQLPQGRADSAGIAPAAHLRLGPGPPRLRPDPPGRECLLGALGLGTRSDRGWQ